MLTRPEKNEYAEPFGQYIDFVPKGFLTFNERLLTIKESEARTYLCFAFCYLFTFFNVHNTLSKSPSG